MDAITRHDLDAQELGIDMPSIPERLQVVTHLVEILSPDAEAVLWGFISDFFSIMPRFLFPTTREEEPLWSENDRETAAKAFADVSAVRKVRQNAYMEYRRTFKEGPENYSLVNELEHLEWLVILAKRCFKADAKALLALERFFHVSRNNRHRFWSLSARLQRVKFVTRQMTTASDMIERHPWLAAHLRGFLCDNEAGLPFSDKDNQAALKSQPKPEITNKGYGTPCPICSKGVYCAAPGLVKLGEEPNPAPIRCESCNQMYHTDCVSASVLQSLNPERKSCSTCGCTFDEKLIIDACHEQVNRCNRVLRKTARSIPRYS